MKKCSTGKSKLLVLTLLALAVVLFCSGASFAAQGLLTDDTYTDSNHSSKTYWNSPTVNVTASPLQTGYFKFDLSPLGDKPAAAIEKVTLILFVEKVKKGGFYEVRRVGPSASTGWTEWALTYGTSSSIAPISDLIATVPIDSNYEKRFIGVDVTNLVKEWVSGAVVNNGIAILPVAGSDIAIQLDSKDNKTTSHEAKLEVSFMPVIGDTGPTGPIPALLA